MLEGYGLIAAEFLRLMYKPKKTINAKQELRQVFTVFDRDGSGTISREDLHEIMTRIGEQVSPLELDAIMAEADRDGNGTISCKLDASELTFR